MDRNMAGQILLVLMCSLIAHVYAARNVTVTRLDSAVAKGAVCLDGSPPGYAYLKGSGEGVNNWIVYLQGGGWCFSKHDCFNRSTTELGSSSPVYPKTQTIFFDGILDDDASYNPNFYNWNIFYILYCDGSSFMSNIQEVEPEYNLTYRGARIFDAMMEELFLHKGMANAQNAILTGTSAGGLATILHCDKFRAPFPAHTKVKCISDSGFFIHGEELNGSEWRENIFSNVVSVHEIANLLPTSCTTKRNPALCLFPEYLVNDVQTPLFLVESAFDLYQISNLIRPTPKWNNCTDGRNNLALCDWNDFKLMQDFRATFIKTLKSVSPSISYFVHSCYRHGHIDKIVEWMCSSLNGNNVLANKTIGQAVSDWYFNQSKFQEIDTQTELPRICSSVPAFDQKCMEFLHTA